MCNSCPVGYVYFIFHQIGILLQGNGITFTMPHAYMCISLFSTVSRYSLKSCVRVPGSLTQCFQFLFIVYFPYVPFSGFIMF